MISYKVLILIYLIISYILSFIFMMSWIIGDLRYNRKVVKKDIIIGFLLFPLALPFMISYLFYQELLKNMEDL